MKLPPFDYHAPDTVDEVVALLAEHGDEAKVLAGGQSLVPLLAMRLARPSQLVDVNRVRALTNLERRNGHLVFGATVRAREVERSAAVAEELPLLAEAMPFIGHVAIRNRGTMGGTVAHADASAEVPAVVLALDGEMLARSARGDRTIPAADFFLGHFTTALADDECLVEVRVPVMERRSGFAFQELARRSGDFALVGVAAAVTLDDAGTIGEARLAIMGVAGAPLRARATERALVGAEGTEDTFTAAAQAATADLQPPSDVHGSAAFRRHVAGVAVRRALVTAHDRARRRVEDGPT